MAYTLNRRLAQLVDSNGQLNTGKIPNDYISSDHIADNVITASMLHTSFTVSTSNLTAIDTDDVSEGSSNLYYTDARADARIAAATTDDLSEGSNLYYTDARVQAISINNVVEDTTPQLGGNLASNGNDILFADNDKAIFGTGSDLEIYHTGTESWIKDAGSGNLYIDSNGAAIQLTSGNAAKSMINAVPDGGVTLFHNNNTKLNTSSDGVTVTGNLAVTGDLDITGNVNSYNVTDLDVTDKTITLGAGQTEANSGGSGIIIDGSNASILWDETNTTWDLNNSLAIRHTTAKIFIQSDDGQSAKVIFGDATDQTRGGIEYTSTDDLVFSNNNSDEKMRIRYTGKVGIDTPNPQGKLTISNGGAEGFEFEPGVTNFSVANTNYIASYDRSASTYRDISFDLGGAATQAIRFKTGGYVGIGISNPLQKFHLYDDGGYYASIQRGNSTPGGSEPWLGLFNDTNIANATYGWAFYDSNGDGSLQLWNKNNNTTGYDVMTFQRGGNVGIGTTAPQSKLETNLHSGADSSLMNANTVNDVHLIRAGFGQNAGTTSNAGAKWGLRFVGRNDGTYDNGKSGAIFAVSEDSAGYNRKVGLTFHTSPFDAAHTERMRIASTGNVGIGVTGNLNNDLGTLLNVNNATIIGNATSGSYFGYNLTYHSSAWKYQESSGVGLLSFTNAGDLTYRAAASGTGNTTAPLEERFVIKQGGNVGIGTSGPVTSLSFGEASTGITFLSTATNFNSGKVAGIRGEVGGTGYGNLAFDTFQGGSGGGERMMIRYDGNVGIGTDSPSYFLHVRSPNASDDVVYIHHDNASQTSGTLLKVRTDAGDSNGYTLLDVQTNSGSALFVRGDRNVGIGTSSPYTKLQIAGSISTKATDGLFYFSDSSSTSIDTSQLGVHWIGRIDTVNYHMTTSAGGFAGQAGTLGIAGKGGITFGTCTASETYASGRMIIDEDGKVGIGTTSPGFPLDVSASIASTIGQTSTYNYSQNRNWAMRTNNYGSANWGGWSLEQSTSAGGAPSVARIGVHINGNVGINMGGDASTSLTDKNPATALHVGGDITVGSADSVGTGGTAAIRFQNDNERSRITSNYASGGGGQMGFWTDTAGGTLLQRMYITNQGHVLPGADNTYDLGSTSTRWRNLYTTDLHLSNEGKPEGNEVDGTTGNWTIQEGEEHLYIINNKSGKKYRFALEEIE